MTHGLRLIAFTTLLCAASPAAGVLLLSEAYYDAPGADQGQIFVELYGPAGCVVDGYTLEGVNGSNGALGPLLDLVGAVPADGFFVIADLDAGVTAVANADLLLNFDLRKKLWSSGDLPMLCHGISEDCVSWGSTGEARSGTPAGSRMAG